MYYLLLAILYPVSLLPLQVLYLFSDLAFIMLYYIRGYRKDVVWDNLRHAFPAKTEEELISIQKKFYHSFCDQWIETLKLLTIPRKQLDNRCKANWEVFENMAAEGKNGYAMLGHTFNWEWANVACAYHAPQLYAGIYLPVTAKAIDKLMYRIRSRSGAVLISMKALKTGLSKLRGGAYILALIADQNPVLYGVAQWESFMHRQAPFFKGGEQMARRAKATVVFAGIKKIKRGHYQISLQKFCDDAGLYDEGEIVKAYVNFLEAQLEAQPENWMWTHRRWKIKKPLYT